MAKKTPQRTFNDVLALLGGQRFDVAPVQDGSKQIAKAVLGKEIRLRGGYRGELRMAHRRDSVSARLLGCSMERSRVCWIAATQKFIKTSKLEIPATADHLWAIHEFSEELNEATGATNLYNEALGTTSNVYNYDRVKGRESEGLLSR